MGDPQVEFSALVLNATEDNAAWREVLEAVMAQCGATVGVISLRELRSASFSFPDDASTELAAPLIVGIPPEHVASYFDQYYEIDPWTVIERQYHPHLPYFMSDRLPIAALQKTEFWNWISPQGICECLVAEIYRSSQHWVALNLLFDQSAISRKTEILDKLAFLLPIMKTGWRLSERITGLNYGRAASNGYLENLPGPCLVLDEDLVVSSANTLGLETFSEHAPLLAPVAIAAPLSLGRGPLRDGLHKFREVDAADTGTDGFLHLPSAKDGYRLKISSVAQGEDIIGKRRAQVLILVESHDAPPQQGDDTLWIWETTGLSRMQSAIVKWIAEGGVTPKFAEHQGIAIKTAYHHLAEARRKLNGMSARDIYTTHQSMLKFRNWKRNP